MNKVTLTGNLTKDPELTSTSSGVNVCKFSIAVSRQFKDANGEKGVDFFNIVAWRKLGENCANYLRKGKKALVIGRIEIRTYEHDGTKKQAFDIVADEVEFLSPVDNDGEEQGYDRGTAAPKKAKTLELTPVDDDDLPF